MAPALSEAQIEGSALKLLAALGWETTNCQQEAFGETGTFGREMDEAFLPTRLRAALRKLNPEAPEAALDDAYEQIDLRRLDGPRPIRRGLDLRGLWASDEDSGELFGGQPTIQAEPGQGCARAPGRREEGSGDILVLEVVVLVAAQTTSGLAHHQHRPFSRVVDFSPGRVRRDVDESCVEKARCAVRRVLHLHEQLIQTFHGVEDPRFYPWLIGRVALVRVTDLVMEVVVHVRP